MSTTDFADETNLLGLAESAVQWPQVSAEGLYAAALSANATAIHGWCKKLGVTAQSTRLIAEDGLLLELQWCDGRGQIWVESHGSPFLDALCLDDKAPQPEWLTACLMAALASSAGELNDLKILAVRKTRRPDTVTEGWSLGAMRLGIVECDAETLARMTVQFVRSRPLAGLKAATTLHVCVGALTSTVLATLTPGDAILLSKDINCSIKGIWTWGPKRKVGAVMSFNWGDNCMTYTGEIEGMNEIAQHGQSDHAEANFNLSDLSIPISFELESGTYQLSVLQSMIPGQLVELKSKPDQCRVRMMSAGRCLGQGRLVQIGNALAVHLEQYGLQLGDPDHA